MKTKGSSLSFDNQHHLELNENQLSRGVFFIKRDFQLAFFSAFQSFNSTLLESILNEMQYNKELEYTFSIDGLYKSFVREELDYKDSYFEDDLRYLFRRVYAEFLISYNMQKYFLSIPEQEKLLSLIKRNDYKSKIITKLFDAVHNFLLIYCSEDRRIDYTAVYAQIYNKISFSIRVYFQEHKNDYVKKHYLNLFEYLNNKIGKIETSVFIEMIKEIERKSDLYKEGMSENYYDSLDSRLESFGIRYESSYIGSFLKQKNLSNESLLIKSFYELLEDKTVPSHILLGIYDYFRIRKNDAYIKLLLSKALEGFFNSNKINPEGVTTLLFSLENAKEIITIEAVKSQFEVNERQLDFKGLILYPIFSDGDESYYQSGLAVFDEFLDQLFGNNKNAFLSIFEDPESLLREQENYENMTKNELRSKHFYDVLKRIWQYASMSHTLKAIEPRFYEGEVSKRRFYITLGVLTELLLDTKAILFDSLNLMFQHVQSKYELDMNDSFYIEKRQPKEKELFKILKDYDIKPVNQTDYLISILDREVATLEQIERFPIIEQMGDAIYEYVVVSALLKDIANESPDTLTNSKNNYIQAKTQVVIAENMGLDKCYIHNKFLTKKVSMDSFDKSMNNIDPYNVEKEDSKSYLADSLEMLIGSVYFEFGLEEAIEFTTKIIMKNLPEIAMLIEKKIDIVFDINTLNLEKAKLFARLNPDLSLLFTGRYSIYHTFGQTLIKLFSVILIGNETLEKRKILRSASYNSSIRINNIDATDYLSIVFLNKGLEYTKEAFKKQILPTIHKNNVEKENKRIEE